VDTNTLQTPDINDFREQKVIEETRQGGEGVPENPVKEAITS
jgi:hypothetical protein